jgi:(R,R)-butanediol dehydrogenase / meso-butanediol dehydrogenase / diacetyl reductase
MAGPEMAGPEMAGPEMAGPETAGPETAGPELAVGMRAVELTGDRTLRLTNRPVPQPLPGDVVVRVEAAGICGSDVRVRRYGSLPAGTVLGHELVGRVSGTGAEVTGFAAGDRVVVVPLAWCGTCRWCGAGEEQLCAGMWPGSVGLGARPGAFAEYLAVDAACCRPFPNGAPAGAGALVEPFAVGVHAVRRSRLAGRPDAPTVVLGAGTIGLMVLAAAGLAGNAPVVVEPNPVRAAAAARMGAATVVDDLAAARKAAGTEPDVVFDCTGAVAAPAGAVEHLAPGGQLVLVGVVEAGEAYPVPGRVWVSRELDCLGSSGYGARDFADALAAVAGGVVDLTPAVGGTRRLDQAEAAFAELDRPDAPAKLLLAP